MKNENKLKYFAIAGICVLVLISVGLFLFNAATSNADAGFSGHFYIAITSVLVKAIFVVVILFYLFPRFSKKLNFLLFIFQLLVWFAGCFATEQFIHYRIIMTVSDSNHLPVIFAGDQFTWVNLFIYVIILLFVFAYYFTREWMKNERQKRDLMEIQFSTELKFLKNQVNPHFLFNTLNNLFSIAQRNNDTETAGGISKLAGLMRYMLYDSSATKVSLEKEIENIKGYIALNKLRYPADEVMVNLQVSGSVEEADIPPMILLPFIENAFKHGIDIEKVCTISIRIAADYGQIDFTCTNMVSNTNVMTHPKHVGIGLENVKRRLLLLYPQKHTLIITDNNDNFTVQLNLQNT